MLSSKKYKPMEIKRIKLVRQLYYTYQNWLSMHSYNKGKNNSIIINGYKVKSRVQIHGFSNQIVIEKMGGMKNTLMHIVGNNNRIIIHEGALVSGAELWIEDNNCAIEIGKNTFVGHHSHLACTENDSQLMIGDDCMLSSYVQVRTGDSHSLLDYDGNRINKAQSVNIGNHCWIGEGAKVLKGVRLEHDVVVSTGAIVTKSFENNVLLGGVPAKVIKEEITWDKQRL